MERTADLNAKLPDTATTTDHPKPAREVDNEAFDAFARRIVRAYARRVADGDVAGLASLVKMSDELNQAMQAAVDGLRDDPWNYSWGDIARNLGVTRSAAYQRWGSPRLDR